MKQYKYKTYIKGMSGGPTGAYGGDQDYLEEQGNFGWELVTVLPIQPRSLVYYWKKEIIKTEKI